MQFRVHFVFLYILYIEWGCGSLEVSAVLLESCGCLFELGLHREGHPV